jgi:hypothetical protein
MRYSGSKPSSYLSGNDARGGVDTRQDRTTMRRNGLVVLSLGWFVSDLLFDYQPAAVRGYEIRAPALSAINNRLALIRKMEPRRFDYTFPTSWFCSSAL